VLLTLRADFYDRPMQYPELFRLIEVQHLALLTIEPDDLRRVIEQPAALPDVQVTFKRSHRTSNAGGGGRGAYRACPARRTLELTTFSHHEEELITFSRIGRGAGEILVGQPWGGHVQAKPPGFPLAPTEKE
jgi:hypothetical protein